MTEGEVLPTTTCLAATYRAAPGQCIPLGTRRRSQGEGLDDDVVDPEIHRQLRALLHRAQQLRDGFRLEDHGRVRIEGKHHRGDVELLGLSHGSVNQLLVSAMYAVEHADCHGCTVEVVGNTIKPVPDTHVGDLNP